MPKISADIPHELARQIDRIIRDGWFSDQESVVRQAIVEFVEGRSFLGDSPRMLHRFAADALNESKPDVALKFVSRGLSLVEAQQSIDYQLYLKLAELRVQILVVMGRDDEAAAALEEAHEKLPNNPTITRWIERLAKQRATAPST